MYSQSKFWPLELSTTQTTVPAAPKDSNTTGHPPTTSAPAPIVADKDSGLIAYRVNRWKGKHIVCGPCWYKTDTKFLFVILCVVSWLNLIKRNIWVLILWTTPVVVCAKILPCGPSHPSKIHQGQNGRMANLVMDTKCFIYNILLAVLPVTFIASMCLWVEDEIKAFLDEMGRVEAEKILGFKADIWEEVSDEKKFEMMVKKSWM